MWRFQMGYAEVGQRGQGIHMRQFSRAFVFVQGDTRLVLVSAEVQSIGIAVRREVSNVVTPGNRIRFFVRSKVMRWNQ